MSLSTHDVVSSFLRVSVEGNATWSRALTLTPTHHVSIGESCCETVVQARALQVLSAAVVRHLARSRELRRFVARLKTQQREDELRAAGVDLKKKKPRTRRERQRAAEKRARQLAQKARNRERYGMEELVVADDAPLLFDMRLDYDRDESIDIKYATNESPVSPFPFTLDAFFR